MLLQHRVHLLTSRACDVAGMLCKLGPPSMQLAESLLESLLKVRALPRQYLYFFVLITQANRVCQSVLLPQLLYAVD
jgi:hypothetical protein